MPLSPWLTGVMKLPTAGSKAANAAVTPSTFGSDILTRSGEEKKTSTSQSSHFHFFNREIAIFEK